MPDTNPVIYPNDRPINILPVSAAAGHRLVALRDCGVVRVKYDDDGLIELHEKGLARVRTVEGDDDALDFSLTAAGKCCV